MSSERSKGATPTPGRRARVLDVGASSGQRLDNFLARTLKGVPRSRIYRMIRSGEVRINGGRSRPAYRLNPGDQVRIPPVREAPASTPAFVGDRQLKALEEAILFEDSTLLVLNKPAGLAVHGGSGVAYGAIEALRRLRPRSDLELVHRLDRDTSGCLLVAKRRSRLRELHARMREGSVGKSYRLIVHGHWPVSLVQMDVPLKRFVSASGERRVRGDAVAGKASLTTFDVVAHAATATLLNAELHTGRTHQIRVHCRIAGHSLVGDEKYAEDADLSADRALGIRRLCLHASRLTVPDEGGERVFEAPLPEDFRDAWSLFERSAPENG